MSESNHQEELPSISESFLTNQHAYLRDNVALADQKAGFLLAASIAVLAYLHGKALPLAPWAAEATGIASANLTAHIALIVTGICALGAVLPRLSSSGSSQSVIYWNDFQDLESPDEYLRRCGGVKLQLALAGHILQLGKILRKKFCLVAIGAWVGTLGILAAVVTLTLN